MSITKTSLIAASALSGIFAFTGAAHAQAFYLQEQSAKAAGRAFSGEAADQGAASLWWNPAAIGGITRGDAVISAAAILPKGKVVDNGTVIARPGQAPAGVGGDSSSSDPINNGVLPSGAIAMPLNDRVAIGLAVTSPYSFTTNYDSDSWARYSADKTRLRTIDIQPSIGIALTDWLRIGGAANIEYTKASLSNKLPNLAAALPDGEQLLKGDGWDVGWTAGVQMQNSFVTVGISYKSAIEHKLKGDLAVSGLLGPLAAQNVTIDGAHASFYTPAQIIVGARFNTGGPLTLNTQFVRYTWHKFDAIRLSNVPASFPSAVPENYRNSWSLAGGIDYAITPAFTVRTGVQRTLTPTRDGERDARVPDSNRWNFALGGSYQMTSHIGLDAAANYIKFKDESIDRLTGAYVGTAAQTVIVTNGSLEDAHALVFSLGAHVTF